MLRRFYYAAFAFLACVKALAVGPDEMFVMAYNLIHQADSQKEAGNVRTAWSVYSQAQEDLRTLQRAYPEWNDRVVNYRLRYVAAMLEELKVFGPTPVTPAKLLPPVIAPAEEEITELTALNDQIRRLGSEKAMLEARLREALSAQPAPIDPRELQRAVEKITTLQATNQGLIQQLEQQQADRRNLIDKVVLEESHRALQDANRQLLAQKTSAAALQKERTELEAALKKLQDTDLKQLKNENSALKSQVTELKSETERGRQIAELTTRISKLQKSFEEARKQNEVLVAEKMALEKQLASGQTRQTESSILRMSKLTTELAVARAEAGRNGARAEDLLAAMEKEKSARTEFETQNRLLTERVSLLTRENAGTTEAVQVLQKALTSEKADRMRMEAELEASEKTVAALREAATFAGNAVATDPTGTEFTVRLNALVGKTRQLELALRDSRDREAEVHLALLEEQSTRRRMEKQRADLDQKLRTLMQAGGAKASLEAFESLENRLKELEREKEELQQQLNRVGGIASGRASPNGRLTPRERAVQFRSER
ncbi:MAG: hypothetical protein EXS36_10045 [Pedosphaera sp.]|nr:hypothetical protein [Pedosphaera sp.]